MTKAQRHEAIRERARKALRNLYHNATVTYPRDVRKEESALFESWFNDNARDEIDYIAAGGAYGLNYGDTLHHEANAGRYKSEPARAFYVERALKKMSRERTRFNAQWETIGGFGTLHTWGRGGRTLAPANLVATRGGSSFSIRDYACDEMAVGEVVNTLERIESFNTYVAAWCESVPELWNEFISEKRDADLQARAAEIEGERPDMYRTASN